MEKSMDWNDIELFLKHRLLPEVDNSKQDLCQNWIEALDSDLDAKRLGASIAIDLASGAVPAKQFAAIANNIDAGISAANPRLAFHFSIANLDVNEQNSLVAVSNFIGDVLPSDECYIRIISLLEFMRFYTPYNSLSMSNINRIRKIYFREWQGQSLDKVREYWTGGNGRVWITSSQDMELVIHSLNKDEHANALNDAFGIGKDKGEELVYVSYPKGFEESVGCAQPTALDATWIDAEGFFLSFGERDCWGRTWSCSGNLERRRERVHSGFKNLTKFYTTRYIGKVTSILFDRSGILEEVYERFGDTLS